MPKMVETPLSEQETKEYKRWQLKRSLLYRAVNTELNVIAKHWVKAEPESKERWENQFEALYEEFLEIYPETREWELTWRMSLEERK